MSRPEILIGTTTKITTSCGSLYVTINYDQDKRPREIFVQMGKAGGCAASQLEAFGRLLTLALKHNVPIEDLIDQMKGIRCPSPSICNGKDYLSCADAVSKILDNQKDGNHG